MLMVPPIEFVFIKTTQSLKTEPKLKKRQSSIPDDAPGATWRVTARATDTGNMIYDMIDYINVRPKADE